VNGPAVHPSTFPDETGAMMWVTDGLGKRRISQTNGGTGRHHWRWDIGWNPIVEYEDAVRFGDRIALAEAASRFCD